MELWIQRRYEIINIPCDLCTHQCIVIVDVSPCSCYIDAQNLWDTQGTPYLFSVVSIADHSHIIFVCGSRGITLVNHHQSFTT